MTQLSNYWVNKQSNNCLLQLAANHLQQRLIPPKKNARDLDSASSIPQKGDTPTKTTPTTLGTYDPDKGYLDLHGSDTTQIASASTAKGMMQNMLLTSESAHPVFVPIEKVIDRIKEHQTTLRVIDLSRNSLDLFSARKVLAVARYCPHIEKLNFQDNSLIAYHQRTRFFDYDLGLFLQKPSVKEVNIQGNTLAKQTKWREFFSKNYGAYASTKLVTKQGEQPQKLPYHEGEMGKLWLYFFS